MEIFDKNYRVNKDIELLELVVSDDMVILNEKNISVFGLGALMITHVKGKEETKELTLATFFETNPREIEKRGEDYVLKYYAGDKFIECADGEVAETTISIDNQEYFFKKMSSGKLKPSQDIEVGFETIMNNLELNAPLDVPFFIKEVYASNIFRDIKKPQYPARVTGADEYAVLSTRDLVSYGSTLTALAFEDATAMVVIKALDKKTPEKITLREKYAKM